MTKRALCIGINDYPGTGSDLSGCVNDAKDWAGMLTGRGFDRAIKVGRTVADLAGEERIGAEHLAEALSYRTGFGTEALADAV